MSSTTIVKPAELGFGIACMTFFLSVMANIRLWYGLVRSRGRRHRLSWEPAANRRAQSS